jgi:hypothetical protein
VAGSNKWFVYTADDGSDFALFRDESNMEAVNGGTQDYVPATAVVYALPRNVTPRRCNFSNSAGTVRRSVVALTQAIYNGILPNATLTDVVSGETLTLSSKDGERIKLPKAADTGLTDGDAT